MENSAACLAWGWRWFDEVGIYDGNGRFSDSAKGHGAHSCPVTR